MDLSVIAFLGLLVVVALLRIVELQISRRHQKEMIARGAAKVDEPRFRWMVLLHTAVLIGAALEVVLLRRPFIPDFSRGHVCDFSGGECCPLVGYPNAREPLERPGDGFDQPRCHLIGAFPLRTPSKLCCGLSEMLSLPLIHTAWITAVVGSLAHVARALDEAFDGRTRSVGESRVSSHHGAQTEIHSRCFLRIVSRPLCCIPALAVFVLLAPAVSRAQTAHEWQRFRIH